MEHCFKTHVRMLVVVLTVLAFVVLGMDVGLAQITDSEEIFAYAHKNNGQLRVVADL